MLILNLVHFLCIDPWICSDNPQYHDWLINLDMALFRNNAIQAGLISSEESENLSATTRSGSQVHNALLLAYAKRGGRKSFLRLLDTLKLMRESGNKKWLQLVNLLPVTEQGTYCACLLAGEVNEKTQLANFRKIILVGNTIAFLV